MVNQESIGKGEPLEIERKFLVKYPDIEKLEQMPGVRKVEILQTYLPMDENLIRRVRERKEGDVTDYWYTEKMRMSEIVRIERESQISYDRYQELLANAATDAQPIRKTRFYLNSEDLCFEIDVYPQWSDRAVVEIELKDENTVVVLPEILEEIREVTRDQRYKNEYLAFNGFDFDD